MGHYVLLIPIFLVSAFLAGLFIVLQARGSNAKTCLIFKTLASIGFLLAAGASIVALVMGQKPYSVIDIVFIMCGLTMGLVGDILLALRECKPNKGDLFILFGISAFLIGHIFYILFLYRHVSIGFIEFVVAAILAVSIIFGGKKLFKNSYRRLLIPALIYAFILSLMMCLSVKGLILGVVSTVSILFVVGSVLFALSDAVLCHMFFGQKQNKILPIVNLSTYYLAQNIIALSLAFSIL